MTATTPFLQQVEKLGPLTSRYVEVESLPWKPTPCPGIDMKVLLEDPETGLLTALFRWQPGSELALHEHVEIEQTFVLEGSLVDDEGEVRAGNYVWRPKGNRHIARAPGGALVLSMFLKPEHIPRRRRGRPGSEVGKKSSHGAQDLWGCTLARGSCVVDGQGARA